MKVKFWGTRGSIATPEPEMMKYGGNTACVEVWTSDGELIIFDAGTGIRRLGLSLLSNPCYKQRGTVFLSHFHWDHIQGFPFFAPLFLPGHHFTFYGQLKMVGRLEESLRGQMGNSYFPVRFEELKSHIEFHEILEETIEVGENLITSRFLRHPQGCLGYRLENEDGIFVYCTDTEHSEGELDPRVLELAREADLFVYDCQYTEEEYREKKGWGHSTWRAAVRICREAGVKQLVMFHHDPLHDDDFIAKMEKEAQSEFAATVAAARDMEVTLCRKGKPHWRSSVEESRCSLGGVRLQKGFLIVSPPSLKEFSSPEYRRQVIEKVEQERAHLVLDFRRLPRVSREALETLLAFLEVTKGLKVHFYLLHLSSLVRENLSLTPLLQYAIPLTLEEWEKLFEGEIFSDKC